jgi:hypothetical protein
MKTITRVAGFVAPFLALSSFAIASQPIIPPTLTTISPSGMQRGTTATFAIDGRNLSGATEVIFDAPGIAGKLTDVQDVPEKITGPRAGEDLAAQVPLGKKQSAKLEITIAKDAEPGIHRFRVKTPLGTSNMLSFAVGTLPEIKMRDKAMDAGAPAQFVDLPATLIGSIEGPGEKDAFEFEGRAGEDIVFRVQASELGSDLASALALTDSEGHVLASDGENTNRSDAALSYHLAQAGKYTITISDRDNAGGRAYFYRLDAGALPYVKNVFPLGVRAGQPTQISVTGVNLGELTGTTVQPPASAQGWTTMRLAAVGNGLHPLNDVRLAVGDAPETLEREPNDSLEQTETVSPPVTINGHISGGSDRDKNPDEDFFRFAAKKGQKLSIDVAASRLGSPIDSVIEILDAKGDPIPRATIRCLNETTTTLADRDSRTDGIRLVSTSGLHEGDYLMVGDELDRIDFIPDQPDADTILTSMGGLRRAYLGTSPDVHAVNTPVYKAQILPPDVEFPSNGLPVFHLTWRNDDGGPGYGSDSMLDFLVPADGDYFVHLKDVRGTEGKDFAYRLAIREETPDFRLTSDPANPNIPRGGTTAVKVSLGAIRGFDSPIDIDVKGLPHGVSASPARILPGQVSTIVVLTAAPDAETDAHPVPIQFVGHISVDGHELARTANREGSEDEPLQLASITPPPDVTVTTEAKGVTLEPGKEVTVTLNIARHNEFTGRVPCSIENLPPGVRVVNVGLNGVLVTESQTSRTFTLHAEDWAKPIDQPIYVVAEVESNSSTKHPSAPMLLKIGSNRQTANETTQPGANRKSANEDSPNQ